MTLNKQLSNYNKLHIKLYKSNNAKPETDRINFTSDLSCLGMPILIY